ncbi:MAG: DUF354 domain-containing protein [Candidatus Kapabacteria bacterium]|nr:DUF354 domain-containing protein [Candidatus Kapabacteria bacterium]
MRIWIDIDNSPHVPFFTPLIAAWQARGDSVLITSRKYAQTRELLTNAGFPFTEVGEHAGASKVKKVLNLIQRSLQLRSVIKTFKPDVAVSHGSRALSVTSKMIGLPNVLFFDYEWTEMSIFKRCATVLSCPEVLPSNVLQQAHIPLQKIIRYNGFKEELYLPSFVPDASFRSSLNIPDDKVFVTIRPSSMTSNYHDSRSEEILVQLIKRFVHQPQAIGLITPRTEVDKQLAERVIEQEHITNVRIATTALPGMQLLYWSDLVVSGGGTMNREAALLGTPTVSMFTGKRPAIDEYLSSQGKLRFIESPAQVADIPFTKHSHNPNYRYTNNGLVPQLMEIVDSVVG